jgi:hypothetical protein
MISISTPEDGHRFNAGDPQTFGGDGGPANSFDVTQGGASVASGSTSDHPSFIANNPKTGKWSVTLNPLPAGLYIFTVNPGRASASRSFSVT